MVACGGTATDAQCAGDYAGSYSGSASGTLSARIHVDRSFSVTFTPESAGSGMSGEGEIDEDGSIDVNVGANRVTGELDFANCTARGNWSLGSVASGNWQARRR
jgi:hypothetical protein